MRGKIDKMNNYQHLHHLGTLSVDCDSSKNIEYATFHDEL